MLNLFSFYEFRPKEVKIKANSCHYSAVLSYIHVFMKWKRVTKKSFAYFFR